MNKNICFVCQMCQENLGGKLNSSNINKDVFLGSFHHPQKIESTVHLFDSQEMHEISFVLDGTSGRSSQIFSASRSDFDF